VVTGQSLRFFRKGIYAPDNIDEFFDKVFQPKDAPADTLTEQDSQELPDKQLLGSLEGPTEEQTEGNLTQVSTKTTEATPSTAGNISAAGNTSATGNTSAAGNTQSKSSDADFDTDGPEDIDAVIEKQINAALESVSEEEECELA
jgi:hypothetical protein